MPNLESLYQGLRSERKRKQTQVRSFEKAVSKFNIEGQLTKTTKGYAPPSARIRLKKYATPLDAAKAMIPKGDPRAQYTAQIRQQYEQVISRPEASAYTPQELFKAAKTQVETAGREKAYRYHEKQQTWFGKPSREPDPGYATWKEQKDVRESLAAGFIDNKWKPTHDFLAGAGFSVAWAGIKGAARIAGFAAKAHPIGRAATLAALAIKAARSGAAFVGFGAGVSAVGKVAQMVDPEGKYKTETDILQIAGGLVPGIGASFALRKFGRSMIKATTAQQKAAEKLAGTEKAVIADPSSLNLLEMQTARETADRAAKVVAEKAGFAWKSSDIDKELRKIAVDLEYAAVKAPKVVARIPKPVPKLVKPKKFVPTAEPFRVLEERATVRRLEAAEELQIDKKFKSTIQNMPELSGKAVENIKAGMPPPLAKLEVIDAGKILKNFKNSKSEKTLQSKIKLDAKQRQNKLETLEKETKKQQTEISARIEFGGVGHGGSPHRMTAEQFTTAKKAGALGDVVKTKTHQQIVEEAARAGTLIPEYNIKKYPTVQKILESTGAKEAGKIAATFEKDMNSQAKSAIDFFGESKLSILPLAGATAAAFGIVGLSAGEADAGVLDTAAKIVVEKMMPLAVQGEKGIAGVASKALEGYKKTFRETYAPKWLSPYDVTPFNVPTPSVTPGDALRKGVEAVEVQAKGGWLEWTRTAYSRGLLYYAEEGGPIRHKMALWQSAVVNRLNSQAAIRNILDAAKVPEMKDAILKQIAKEHASIARTDLLEFAPKFSDLKQERINFKTLTNRLKTPGKGANRATIEKYNELKLAAEAAEERSYNAGLESAELKERWIREVKEPTLVLYEKWAKQEAEVRIFLAAEDTVEHTYYPFLRGLLSTDEKVAVGRLKTHMLRYKSRMELEGNKSTLERSFMTHAMNPLITSKEILEAQGKRRIGDLQPDGSFKPLTKLYSRRRESLSFMPTATYSTDVYFMDVNKRLGNIQFWNYWRKHSDSAMSNVEHQKGLGDFWRMLSVADKPAYEATAVNQALDYLQKGTVAQLLFLNVGSSFKHLLKFSNQLVLFGTGPETIKSFSAGVRHVGNKTRLQAIHGKDWARKLSQTNDNDLIRAFSDMGNYMDIIADHGYKTHWVKNGIDNMLNKINHTGTMLIQMAETVDRGASVTGALAMAAKRGMTAEQAYYGVYDAILKSNGIGAWNSPMWLRTPLTRAFFMFQGTPFRILEHRLYVASRGGKALGKTFIAGIKNPKHVLDSIRAMMKRGEYEFKANLVRDAWNSEQDAFGTPLATQFIRQLAVMGAIIGGGAMLGHDLKEHVTHTPVFHATDGGLIKLGGPPILEAAMKSMSQASREDREWEFNDFLRKWLGHWSVKKWIQVIGGAPIPAIYDDDGTDVSNRLSWLFSVPAKD